MGWFERLIGGSEPSPKQEDEPERPQAFEWADQINRTHRHSDERWEVWREAYQSGVVLDVNLSLGKPGEPDFYPEGALEDYVLSRGIETAQCPKCGAWYFVSTGPWCFCE